MGAAVTERKNHHCRRPSGWSVRTLGNTNPDPTPNPIVNPNPNATEPNQFSPSQPVLKGLTAALRLAKKGYSVEVPIGLRLGLRLRLELELRLTSFYLRLRLGPYSNLTLILPLIPYPMDR